MDEKEKNPLMEKTNSGIILSLEDIALREVEKKRTVAKIWTKLKSLYNEKSLHNTLFMKQKTICIQDGER